MTDYDGTITLSPVVYVEATATLTALFALYPNPTTGTTARLSLATSTSGTGELSVAVYSSDGRRVYTARLASTGGPAPLPYLKPGNYLVRVTSQDGRQQSQWLTVSR